MLPKIHSTGGHSFKGCINYLLHGELLPAEERDQAEEIDQRVAWTLTGNLGTNDVATAGRVMAAYAMKAEELKANAGVSNRGKPTTEGAVLHYTLSWKDDEIKNLTKEEMQRAAVNSIAVLGKDTTKGKRVPKDGGRRQFADQHQYIVVCHNDKDHPHVHVVINTVHPEHGRRLPTSNDQRKLSNWARKYQREHNNEHLCPAREANYKARQYNEAKNKSKHFVKAERELSRQEWEAQRQVQHTVAKELLQKKHREQAASIARDGRQQKKEHAAQWKELQAEHQSRKDGLYDQAGKDFRRERQKIVTASNQKIKELMAERDADLAEYRLREKSFLGRLQNTWEAMKHYGSKVLYDEEPRSLFSAAFQAVFNVHADKDARRRPIDAKHDKREQEHYRQVDAKIRAAKQAADRSRSQRLQDSRDQFARQREKLIAQQKKDAGTIKTRWRAYHTQRKNAWQALKERYPLKPGQKSQPTKTRREHLLPREGSKAAVKKIDQHHQRIAEQLQKEADKKKDQGQNEGRHR